ncbi:MAG: HAD hydrolase-like protein [Angelakisella sp.]
MTNSKTYRYFLFDFDGTLVDSSPSIYASLRNVERIKGLTPIPEQELFRFVGPPLSEAFVNYYHAAPEEVPELLRTYRADYQANTAPLTTVYPGVPELLKYIKENGCMVGVATLKNHAAAERTLRDLGLLQYVDGLTALVDGVKITKCELIEQCLALLGNPPRDQAIFFGDSRYDGVGAMEAGMDFVALTYGFGFLEPGSLEGIPTVFCAAQPKDLGEFVKNSLQAE